MGHTSQDDLKAKLDEAKSKVIIGGKYIHYSDPNKLYEVVDIVLYEATEEPVVIYKAEYGEFLTWARDLDKFIEEIEIEDLMKPRFSLVK